MKVNSASVNNLRLAGSFVTYGEPNVKTVSPFAPLTPTLSSPTQLSAAPRESPCQGICPQVVVW